MKTLHKVIFYTYGVLCLVSGALLLVIPGRFLGALGWAPIDPLLSRLFGAGLLGMAWGAWRGGRTGGAKPAVYLAEIFFFFTALGSIGLLRHLLVAYYPLMVWTLCAVLILFSVLWAVTWLQLRKA